MNAYKLIALIVVGIAESSTFAGPPCDPSDDFAQLRIVETASWTFMPHDLPASSGTTLNDPLDINTHASNVNDPWTTSTNQNLWPAALNNVQFSSNMTPNGALTPRGANGLTFANGLLPGIPSALGPTNVNDSLSISFSTPGPRRVVGLGLEIAGGGNIRVRLFYRNSRFLEQTDYTVGVPAGQKVAVGFFKSKIERIDIWNPAGGFETIASIKTYHRVTVDCNGDGTVGVPDLLSIINNWGPCSVPDHCLADIAPPSGDNTVGVPDLLAIINSWGPFTEADPNCFGESPAAGSCNNDSQCFPGVCDFTADCTPSLCICDGGQWICTTDCCGHCTSIAK